MNCKDIHTVENSVSLLLKFLNYFDGITDELEESHFYNNPICVVPVTDQNEGITKEVQIGYHQSLRHLRLVIAEAFHISSREFALEDERYTYSENADNKISEISESQRKFYIKRTKSFYSSNHPKNQLIADQSFFNRIFELLSLDAGFIDYWSLLMKLPINIQLKEKLQNLDLDMDNLKDSWTLILDGHSLHKLLYSLKLVKQLMGDVAWKENFCLKRGVDHLLNQIVEINTDHLNSNLSF